MSDNYVIIQNRIENGPEGTPIITEVLLAYPDSEFNAKKRILKWKMILEIPNIRIRKATPEDRRKRSKKKKQKK
jgi:hypothetical protein